MSRAVLLAAVALAACADPVSPPPVPAELVVLKAAPAVTTPGAQIDTISVRLLDASGRPVAGQRVTWSGDGTVTSLDSVTDELGLSHASWVLPRYREVESEIWAVGPSGHYRATARADAVDPVTLETTAQAFTVDQLDASGSYACGVRQREVWCWGYNPWPLMWSIGARVPHQLDLPDALSAAQVAATPEMLCVRTVEGPILCATRRYSGGFGRVASVVPVLELVAAGDFFCGRRLSRGVACFDVDGPRALLGFDKLDLPTTSVAGGDGFACATTDAGAAWCWGRNDHGQLGNGLTTDSEQPVRVWAPEPFARVVAGGRGACGLTSGQEVWCWGRAVLLDDSPLPRKVTLPGVQGPNFDLGNFGEGYTWNGGTLHTWFNGDFVPLWGATEQFHQVVDLSMQSQGCVRTATSEVLCSWILLYGGGDTSLLPAELVPVPDPASQP